MTRTAAMVLPSRKLVLLLLVPVAALVVLPWEPVVYFALVYDLALLGLAGVDLYLSAKPAEVRVSRRMPEHLSLGAQSEAGWDVHNTSGMEVALRITEDVPEVIEREGLPMRGRLRARSHAALRYKIRPTRRGRYECGDIHFRYETRLGLAVRQRRIRLRTPVKVYPNVANLRRYELSAQRRALAELGLMPVRQRGQGGIYEGLRDYVPGDDVGDIAWKATARRGRPVTRTYETDRSQNVLVVIDCGRLMAPEVDHLTRLDHAINAALLLTYVTVKQGDYIGMLAFSDRIERYVPPVKGRMALSRMKEAMYRLEPRLCEPSYEQAGRFLGLRHRKRSLMIILTDVVDVEASGALLTYSARFARRHLPLCVTMRNLEVEAIARAMPERAEDCFEQAVAIQMLERRSVALSRMERSGVDVLDTDPRELSPRLIHRYLSLKRRLRI